MALFYQLAINYRLHPGFPALIFLIVTASGSSHNGICGILLSSKFLISQTLQQAIN